MHVSIDGYTLKCENCKKDRLDIHFDLGMTYLWSNQHGCKIRLFCHRCGAVHDVTIKPGTEPVIQRQTWQCSVPAKSWEV